MAITSNVKVSELAPVETVSSTTLFPVSVVSSIDAEGLPVFLSKKTSLGQMSSYIGSYLLENQSFVESLCKELEDESNGFMDYVNNHVSYYLAESIDFIESIASTVAKDTSIMMGSAIILSWQGSIESTRLTVPADYRRKNLIVSYSYKEEKDGKLKENNVSEKYIGDSMIDNDWIDSSNWTSLAGGDSNMTISNETINIG